MKATVLIFASMALSASINAATFYKCVDASGKVTFTDSNCPANHNLNDVVTAYNPRISGSGSDVRMAEPAARIYSQPTYRANEARQAQAPAIARGCSTGLSDQDLRTAKVRGEIVPGMTRKEIASIYGNPTEKGAQGGGTSTYWRKGYRELVSVNYDRSGCVKSSYQSGVTP